MTTLLVASGGGHLKQLRGLADRFDIDDDRLWVTFDTGLSRSILQTDNVVFAPYAHPHDIWGNLKDVVFALKLFRKHKVSRVISTGANVAVCFLPFAWIFGAKAIYIETATRTHELSLTGKIVDRLPRIKRYCQSPALANKRWTYAGSVFDGFEAKHRPLANGVKSIVVTLGSNDSYGFDRLLKRVLEIVPPQVDVTWQTGKTDITIEGAHRSMSGDDLEAAMERADVVIAHAGTGSALSALEAGKYPVLVIRRAKHHEHIDDHQELTAKRLSVANLALPVEADELTWQDIETAGNWHVAFNAGHLPKLG